MLPKGQEMINREKVFGYGWGRFTGGLDWVALRSGAVVGLGRTFSMQ